MSDAPQEKKMGRAARLLSRLTVSVLCILLLIALSIRIYLATPYPASQLSRFVSSLLHQGFLVQSLEISGSTLILKGVRLENPAGFPQGSLVAADSVAVAPKWSDLLQGGQRFRLIALEGIKVNLEKNAKGVWNFAELQRLLAARKPSAESAETYVGKLVVRNGSFQVQGQGVRGISLQLFNLATKGSLDSQVALAFEDAAHNRYSLNGKARGGADTALDLTLTAPALSLKGVALLLKLKNPALFEEGKGALQVNAVLQKGELSTRGNFSFSGLQLPAAGAAGRGYPLKGGLHFAADYSSRTDTARLVSSTLTVQGLTELRAQGEVRGVQGQREFDLQLAMEEVDLAILNLLLPEQIRRELLVGGRLGCKSLRMAGDGKTGLKSADGTLQLRDGRLARAGQLLVAGLSGSIGVSRQDTAIVAKGRLSVSGAHDKALLEALDLPLTIAVTRKLRPIRADVPALSATVTGIPIRGRLSFDAGKANPINVSLGVTAASVTALNPLFKRQGVSASSGTLSATVEAAGKSAQELSATAKVQLSDLRGIRGKDAFAAKKGTIAARVQRSAGRVTAQGTMDFTALAINGKAADARFGYRFADGVVHLDDTHLDAAGARISISRLTARIPVKKTAGGVTSYPVSLDIDGCDLKQREQEVNDLAGRLRLSLNTAGTVRWLEGTADLSSGAKWQGKTVAAPALHLAFSRAGGRGELSGQLLGGTTAGTASFNPFAPEAGATFEIGVAGAKLAAAAALLPRSTGGRPADGTIDLRLRGGYSSRDGLACRWESKGSGIALANNDGKTLVAGAGLSATGALSGGDLRIDDSVLSAGPGVALKLKGELIQALSANRRGALTFSVPETTLNGMIDTFVNILPPLIQEATVDGTVAADGKVELQDGKKLLHGALTFNGGRLDVPSQKLLVADINGKFPFSLDLSGKAGGRPPQSMDFSRENYPRLPELLRKPVPGGEVVTVGKIGFGALELGKLTLHLAANNGTTEISSLTTSLYEGALLGRGFVTIKDKLNYRGDLVINGLSMRALCRTLPIEGYIAGRVDGVISLNGAGKGLAGMTGFANLWARPGAGEKMVVSKEFLQRLAKQKLSGFFFSSDRAYDQAEIKAMLKQGDLTFDALKIVNTNLFGVRDLNVTIAPGQNRIALDHLLESIKEAAVRGKPTGGEPAQAPVTQEFKWGE